MILATMLVFLQLSTFQEYVNKATEFLGLEPIYAHRYSKRFDPDNDGLPALAWADYELVPHRGTRKIHVWTRLLSRHRNALRIVASHEACHHYLSPIPQNYALRYGRVPPPHLEELNHALVRRCTVVVIGEDEFNAIVRDYRTDQFIRSLQDVREWRSQCR